MANSPLNLDKERLVRLQAQQMQALSGGAGAADQSTDTDVTVELPDLRSQTGGNGKTTDSLAGDRSCCKKSCNGPATA